MLKIRLKRLGAKKNPTYRVIVINSTTKREGRPIEELGHYNPKTKEMKLNKESALAWIAKGAQPTETVAYLIKNCNDDGTLNYVKKETVKLSKKALAKKQAEEESAVNVKKLLLKRKFYTTKEIKKAESFLRVLFFLHIGFNLAPLPL